MYYANYYFFEKKKISMEMVDRKRKDFVVS